jgi:ribosomal protein S18 acetylase RimI-like enzyme
VTISYTDSSQGITVEQLQGFFVDWPNPPSPETHLRLLRGSDLVELAIDSEHQQVVGYITAITDGVLCAYIPMLEVLPDYQGRGIGSELPRRVLERLSHLYIIDLLCDADLQGFYARAGMQPTTGMLIRRYDRQDG